MRSIGDIVTASKETFTPTCMTQSHILRVRGLLNSPAVYSPNVCIGVRTNLTALWCSLNRRKLASLTPRWRTTKCASLTLYSQRRTRQISSPYRCSNLSASRLRKRRRKTRRTNRSQCIGWASCFLYNICEIRPADTCTVCPLDTASAHRCTTLSPRKRRMSRLRRRPDPFPGPNRARRRRRQSRRHRRRRRWHRHRRCLRSAEVGQSTTRSATHLQVTWHLQQWRFQFDSLWCCSEISPMRDLKTKLVPFCSWIARCRYQNSPIKRVCFRRIPLKYIFNTQ